MRRGLIAGLLLGVPCVVALESCCGPIDHLHIRDGTYRMSRQDNSFPDELDHVELVIDEDDAFFTIVANDGGEVELHYRLAGIKD